MFKLTLFLVLPFALLEADCGEVAASAFWWFLERSLSPADRASRYYHVLGQVVSHDDRNYVGVPNPSRSAHHLLRQEVFAQTAPFNSFNLFLYTVRNLFSMSSRERIPSLVIGYFVCLVAGNAALGALFPLVHGLSYSADIHGLQAMCLWGCLMSLLATMPLMPLAFRSYKFSLELIAFPRLSEVALESGIKQYLSPSPFHILSHAVFAARPDLMPTEVVKVVASFLTLDNFVFEPSGMGMEELLKLKEE